MRKIALDLEMNQPSGKIIQVGAVCFEPDTGKLIDTFNELVNPGEPLLSAITTLTGITDADLLGKPALADVAHRVVEFKQKYQINAVAVVWGGARTNDVLQLFDQSGVENPFKTRVQDVKGHYETLADSLGSKMRQESGLEKACRAVGIGWDSQFGPPHNALADAFNTMRLHVFLSRCMVGGFKLKRSFDF